MTNIELMRICIAHWKNIVKLEEQHGKGLSNKRTPFKYKGKFYDSDDWSGNCILCHHNDCDNCPMYKHWNLKEPTTTCMQKNSVYINWIDGNGTAKDVLKVLQARLKKLLKEEK